MKKQIQKTKKQKPFDFILCITVLLLLALGIIMVLSASAPSSLAESSKGDSYIYLRKQAISAALGIAVMLFLSKIDYKKYKKYYKIGYVVSVLLLLAVPLIGYSSGGAKRWIDLGFTTFQPSEVVKLLLIIFYSAILSNNKERLEKFFSGFVYYFLFLIPILRNITRISKTFKCIHSNSSNYRNYNSSSRLQVEACDNNNIMCWYSRSYSSIRIWCRI